MSLTSMHEFAGIGGDGEGARRVKDLTPIFAANHNPDAIAAHAANHPDVEHWCGDVQNAGGTPTFPHADIAWHSPACPDWTTAKGVQRTFDLQNLQIGLWEAEKSPEALAEEAAAKRSRALMEEVVIYLRTWHRRGKIIKAGVVENVVDCRKWADWNRWIGEIKSLGYHVRVIALNSMHALAPTSRRCPQSRDRLYVAYIHKSIARTPDWNRWLRPVAHCDICDQRVRAIQAFKNPSNDMGKYGRHAQYLYRCPNSTCKHQVVEPEVLSASSIIDVNDLGRPIHSRPSTPKKPHGLSPKTIARIEAGMKRYWAPLLTPTGGSGRETGLALPPFITPLRGGGDQGNAYPADRYLHTFTAGGFHHGLANAPKLLVEYYGTGRAFPETRPVGTLPTKDRFGLATAPASPTSEFDIGDVMFRMLNIPEIRAAMAFPDRYKLIAPSKSINARLLGNAVTPNAAEVILSALVEAVTGEQRPSGWDLYEAHGWNHWDLAA